MSFHTDFHCFLLTIIKICCESTFCVSIIKAVFICFRQLARAAAWIPSKSPLFSYVYRICVLRWLV